MFDNNVLNAVIGLVFIFLLYSLFATALQEAIANLLQRRANMLQYGIKVMLTKTVNNSNLSKMELIWYYVKKALGTWRGNLESLWRKRPVRTLTERFYNHPIIKNYGQNSWFSKPSYIGPTNFATVLIDTIKNIDPANASKSADFEMIKNVLAQFNTEVRYRYVNKYRLASTVGVVYAAADESKNKKYEYTVNGYTYRSSGMLAYTPDIRAYDESVPSGTPDETIWGVTISRDVRLIDKETLEILTYHLNEAAGDLDVFRSRLEKWFNDTMDRVTGWYKKSTHYWLFAIGMALAFSLNIDTIEITNYLSKNKAAAAQLAKMGEAAVSAGNSGTYNIKDTIARTALDSIKNDMQQVNTLLGLGWGDYGRTDLNFVRSLQQKKWGKWYLLYLLPRDSTLGERYAINQTTKDSISALLAQQIQSVQADITGDLSRLAASPTKVDSQKLVSDSAKLKTAIMTLPFRTDSMQLLAFYDQAAKEYSKCIEVCYISSRTKGNQKLFGFFITAIAIGLGAPFWYDLLNKLVNIKSAGKMPDGSTKNATSSSGSENIDG